MLHERVIRGRRVERDDWRFLGLDPTDDLEGLPGGRIVVPLATWKSKREALLARRDAGVWLAPDEDPTDIAADVESLPIVGVHFPKFTDGRGYSTAVLLRRRFGYHGELRAFGDVGRDQLFYLMRSGFDAFSLAPHRNPDAALASLGDFSVRYQGSVDDPLPLFRKREISREASR